eukprot:CAMPEP_0178963618 /NCGR_PEP_ID=MMETSP0789-20121207/15140_1 /TAXON_ID=3005 /ORGANISM="Rhizosolenia setigera, Strain CCMP 1694" /LENGTH=533 /DNA_ID=CAMNT_0020648139 /DNA_START=368 /DNA_END=1969 /DNA_ORIENTATION=+
MRKKALRSIILSFVNTHFSKPIESAFLTSSAFRQQTIPEITQSRSYIPSLSESNSDDINEDNYENALVDLFHGDEDKKLLLGQTTNIPLDSFCHWLKKGELKLAPNYQRSYVWKPERASRLVVTVLAKRFVSGIVIHERENGTYDVVDGKQRLTSLLSFYLAGEDPELYEKEITKYCNFNRLTKLDENYESLEGLTFNDLSEKRRKTFGKYSLTCTTIQPATPKEDVFSCYEDINSGGEDLNAQQLRRAVYYGEYIKMLDRLVLNKDFQCIRDPKNFRKGTYVTCPKESDRELILRAFAWYRNYRNFKRPLKNFLNQELQFYDKFNSTDPEKSNSELEKLEEKFTTIMKIWRNVFSESDGAFRKYDQKKNGEWSWSTSINAQIWDAMYLVVAFTYPKEPIYTKCKDKLQSAIKDLFEKGELDVSGAVTIPKFIERKNTIFNALNNVLEKVPDKDKRDSRNFKNGAKLKKDLYKAQNGRCTICNQTIDPNRLDDGAYVNLDHKIPYSKGGSSTVDNAALTHASCNQSKGNRIDN